jgi:hypothetical protein
MIIHIEGFDQNNNFITETIKTHSPLIKDLGEFSFYNWYKDGTPLNPDADVLEDNESYEIMFNKENINLCIQNKNKTIITPLVSKNITIGELKNILSIKDNIYFNREKLKDNKTIEYYNINNMDKLICIYSSPAVDLC